jgi:hypothetical protein
MAEEVTIVIKGENKASGPINDAKNSIAGLEFAADQSSTKLRGMGGGLSSMASFASKAAGPLAIATAGIVAFQQGLSKAIELNAKLGAFEAIEGDLKQAMLNTGIAASVAEQQFDSLAVAVREMSEQTGIKVSELNGAMRELVTRTGDSTAAQENLERVMALMNMTGKGSEEVAKALGNALNGQVGPLVELGILTQEQATELGKMADKSAAAAQAMEILDQKTQGFAKGLPESASAAGRLSAAMERLEVSTGRLFGVDTIVSGLASAVEGVTGQVEAFTAAWDRAPQSITAAMNAVQDASNQMVESIDITTREFQTSLGNRLMASATAAAEQQKYLREQALAEGVITAEQYAREVERIEENLQNQLYKIRIQRGLELDPERGQSQMERAIMLEGQRNALLQVRDESMRFQLETDIAISNVATERMNALARTTDQAERAEIERLFALKEQNVALERQAQLEQIQARQRRPAGVRAAEPAVDPAAIIAQAQKEAEAARKKAEAEAEAAAALERRNAIATARLALLREEDVLVRAGLEATIKELELEGRKLTDLEREYEQTAINFELEKTREAFAQEATARKKQAIQDDMAAKGAAIAKEKELAAAAYAANTEIIRGLDQAIPGLGQLAAGLREVSTQQWNNAEGAEAAVAAMGGLTSLGGQLAGMITSDRKKAAKVEAGFHAAAAIGAFAAWAASSFTLANYGVAAAQHGVAAAKFAMVAGSGGSSQTPSRGGAGGGGGGGAGMLARDRATTSTQQAKPADIVINVDMGSSTNLRSAVDTGREIGQSVADAARNEFRL